MAEPTEEMHDYMHMLTGKNPRDYAKKPAQADAASAGGPPAGGAAPAAWTFSPLKPLAPPSLSDPRLLEAIDEAKRWVRNYLANNKAAAAPGSDPAKPPVQMVFNGKPMTIDAVVATVLAAARMAKMSTGDAGRASVTDGLVRGVIAEAAAPPAKQDAAPKQDDAAKKEDPAKKDDDAIDTSVETTNKHVDTQIQVTINLRAVPDDKRLVVILPDIEVTLHVGKDADSSSVEAQLNLVKIKKDVSDRMRVNGHVIVQSINFKAGVSGEANMTDVALLRIQKSLEVKFKAELEFKITNHISFSLQAEAGKDGAIIGPALTYHF